MLLDSFKIYTSMTTLFQKIKIFFLNDAVFLLSAALISESPVDFSLKIFYNIGMFSCTV